MKAKILTPVVSVFNNYGTFDYEGNLAVMEHLISGGVDGILPLGSTGEYTTLSLEAKKDFLDFYITKAAGRVEILPGTGSENANEAVELSNYILKNHGNKVKGVLVISEYYYNMSPDDFYRYYEYMANKIDGPVYLYNYPQRTGNNIPADIVIKLAENFDNIVGLKDSVIDFSHTAEILAKVKDVKPDFEVYSGYDDQFIDNVSLGGAGGIGALSNLFPGLWSKWVDAVNKNDSENIEICKNKICRLMEIYSLNSNPQKTLKELLIYKGINVNSYCQFPFDFITREAIFKGRELIKEVGE